MNIIIAASAAALALIGFSIPAQAVTANQYASQGEGVYTTSKGVPDGYYRPHRYYRPELQYRRVYHPPVLQRNEEEGYEPDTED